MGVSQDHRSLCQGFGLTQGQVVANALAGLALERCLLGGHCSRELYVVSRRGANKLELLGQVPHTKKG